MTVDAVQRVLHLGDLVLPPFGQILCDLDGCLIAGSHVFPGAATLVQAVRARLWIVSNNSYDTGETLAVRLEGLGLPLAADRLLLAGEQALRILGARHPGASVRFYGSDVLRAALPRHGLRDARSEGLRGDIVLLARDPDFRLAEIAEARAAVVAGAELVVTNTDVAFPGPDGAPIPETGALLAGLLAVAPRLAYRQIGKPAPYLIEAALERSGAAAADCLFIGDNPGTDGVAAAAAGIPFCHVDRQAPSREVA